MTSVLDDPAPHPIASAGPLQLEEWNRQRTTGPQPSADLEEVVIERGAIPIAAPPADVQVGALRIDDLVAVGDRRCLDEQEPLARRAEHFDRSASSLIVTRQ